ncbi:MAG TPA: peptide chain release factor N(5)-glutamine methyltransferase, partial [Candidatus Binataceae bacterium]|nr:peptide chain release factor N(5)-glutamine methyltransferase [Candidatus Binataceae bacterium]
MSGRPRPVSSTPPGAFFYRDRERPTPNASTPSAAGLIADTNAALAAAGIDNPRLDAEAMLAEAAGATRAAIIAGLTEIDDRARERFAAIVARRARREPLAYIVGHKEFYSLDFETTPAALIPRPETETVVSAALEFIERRRDARVLDIGTGSGAIALAIAAHAPEIGITATDISAEGLALARRNAFRLGFAERVGLRLADCFTPIDGGPALGRFDLIVSNPPYIEDDQIAGLEPEISGYEPRIALAGGPDGLDFYR